MTVDHDSALPEQIILTGWLLEVIQLNSVQSQVEVINQYGLSPIEMYFLITKINLPLSKFIVELTASNYTLILYCVMNMRDTSDTFQTGVFACMFDQRSGFKSGCSISVQYNSKLLM